MAKPKDFEQLLGEETALKEEIPTVQVVSGEPTNPTQPTEPIEPTEPPTPPKLDAKMTTELVVGGGAVGFTILLSFFDKLKHLENGDLTTYKKWKKEGANTFENDTDREAVNRVKDHIEAKENYSFDENEIEQLTKAFEPLVEKWIKQPLTPEHLAFGTLGMILFTKGLYLLGR